MRRTLLAGGSLAILMGAGLILPAAVARLETGTWTSASLLLLAAGTGSVVGGMAAIAAGRRSRREPMPSGVRAAVMANGLLLAFLALELSDRIVRQNWSLFYWTTFLLPPALATYWGLVAGQRWSWRVVRVAAVLGVLWFVTFAAMIPFVHLQADGVPTPWYGRLYMIGMSLAFAGIMAVAYRSLGQRETRSCFRLPAHASLSRDRSADPSVDG